MQDITKTSKMETLVDTDLQDLRITGQHMAIPRWIREPAPPTLLALACLEFRPEQSHRVVEPDVQVSPHAD